MWLFCCFLVFLVILYYITLSVVIHFFLLFLIMVFPRATILSLMLAIVSSWHLIFISSLSSKFNLIEATVGLRFVLMYNLINSSKSLVNYEFWRVLHFLLLRPLQMDSFNEDLVSFTASSNGLSIIQVFRNSSLGESWAVSYSSLSESWVVSSSFFNTGMSSVSSQCAAGVLGVCRLGICGVDGSDRTNEHILTAFSAPVAIS